MDVEDQSGSGEGKATVSFPVGLALLVIVLLGIIAFFFCCLYWDRLRTFLYGPANDSLQIPDEKPLRSDHPKGKQIDEEARSVTVLMPGDEIPKFIAVACPCEPPIPMRITVVVHEPVVVDDH